MEEHAHIVEQLGKPQNIDIVDQMDEPQTMDIVDLLDEPSRNKDSAIIQFHEVPFKTIVSATTIDLSEQIQQFDQVKVQSLTVPMHNTNDLTTQHDTDTEEANHVNIHGAEQDLHIKSHSDEHMNINQEIAVPVINISTATVTALSKSQVIQDQTASLEDRSYECAVCGKQFQTFGHLKEHKGSHSGKKACRWARCDICGNLFHYSQTIEEHKSIHSGEMPNKCAMCRKQFRQTRSTNIQDKPSSINDYQHKPTNINDYQDKSTKINKPSLKAHKSIHSKEKPYKCDICSNQYRLFIFLKHHMNSHSIDQLYQCNVCGECFKDTGSIKMHSHTHITPMKIRTCALCGKRCMDTHSFINHMIAHDVSMTNSICQYCGKSYTESPCFMEHFLGGVRRVHRCKVCGKIYKDYCCIIKHIREHGTPIKCDESDMSLRTPYKILTEEDSKTKGTGQSDRKSESADHMNTNQEENAVPIIPNSAATDTVLSKSPVIQDETASFQDRSDSYEKSHILSLLEIWLPCVTYAHSISPMSGQDISIKLEPFEDLTTDGIVQATSGIKSPVIQDETASFEDRSESNENSKIQDISIMSELLEDSTTDDDAQATSDIIIKSESCEEMYRSHVFKKQDTDIKSESADHMNTNQEEIAVPVIPKSAATATVLSKSPVIQDETASFEDRSDSNGNSKIQDITIKSGPLEYLTTVISKSPVIQTTSGIIIKSKSYDEMYRSHVFNEQDTDIKSESDVNIKSEYDVDTTLTTIYSTQDISIKSDSLEDSTTDGVGIKSESYDHEMDTNHGFSEDTNIKCESDDHMNINQEEITVPVIPNSAASVTILSKSPAIQDQTASFEYRSYKCDVCEKVFDHCCKLQEHKRVHLTDVCGAQTQQYFCLKDHSYSINSGGKTYKCAACGKEFPKIQHLRVHRYHTHFKKTTYQ